MSGDQRAEKIATHAEWLKTLSREQLRFYALLQTRNERERSDLLTRVKKLKSALERARGDINWMLNMEKFLTPGCFDYIDAALADSEEER